jgi:hypothetical protein
MLSASGAQNYDTSDSKLRREFEQYGAIKKVHRPTKKDTRWPPVGLWLSFPTFGLA